MGLRRSIAEGPLRRSCQVDRHPQRDCSHRRTLLYTSRYELQQKYLAGIEEKFGVPMLVMPLLDEEIKGLARLKQAAAVLFGDELRGGSEVNPVQVRAFSSLILAHSR